MHDTPTTSTDDLALLLELMPPRVRAALATRPATQSLIEIVLDLGRPPEARYPERGERLDDTPVSADEIAQVVRGVGAFGPDNRAGIERTLHRISALRNRRGDVVGLTCRVGRAVVGTLDIVRDVIEDGRSVLLLGRPGVGKTTLLREAARVLADELEKRVVVVDTSNEIAGDGDIPHPGIGRARRMQVPSPERQHAVMIEAVENHMPEVVVIDEIGTQAEALAARTIAERGVQLIATAHGNNLENLLQNPTLSDLVGGIQAVTLSDDEARRRRTQKTVLERKAPPTFDVLVEIQAKDRLAVHHDVAEVVDRMLRDLPAAAEVRIRGEDGDVAVSVPKPIDIDRQDDRRGRSPLRSGHRFQRGLKIFPFAVSRGRLERAVEQLGAAISLVDAVRAADVVLTVKSQERRQPKALRNAEAAGARIEVIRSNTQHQLEAFLRRELGLTERNDDDLPVAASPEVIRAIARVRGEGQPVALKPQQRHIRRLQHEIAQQHGLASASRGEEPERQVIILPPGQYLD
ncbi:MAG: R3H domain-containing nucleic acid-binding protein [Acidobacteriota bacterium]